MNPEVNKLKNGLKIIESDRHNTESCYIYWTVASGSMTDPTEHSGLSHFLEHSLFSGTKKLATEQQVWELSESLGASINAFTTKDSTTIFCRVVKNNLDQTLNLIADLLFKPQFSQDEFDKEILILMAELEKSKTNNNSTAMRVVLSRLFGKHVVAKDIIGTRESIENLSLEAVREYHEKLYVPNNSALVILGGSASSLTNYQFPNREKVEMAIPETSGLKQSSITSVEADVSGPFVAIGFQTENSQNQQAWIFDLAAFALGEMASFGLRNLIRFREGLAYSVSSGWNGYVVGSHVYVFVRCEKSNIAEVTKISEEFVENLTTLVINEDTFMRIKTAYASQYLASMDNPSTYARKLSYVGSFDAWNLMPDSQTIQSLTAGDFLTTIKDWLSRYVIVQILPKK